MIDEPLWLKVAADVAQSLGALGVLFGAPFVILQIKAGNKALRSAAYQGMVGNSLTLLGNALNDEGMLAIVTTKLASSGDPSAKEGVRWHLMVLGTMRHFENLLVQHTLQSIDEDQWSGYRRLLAWYLKKSGFAEWWADEEHQGWFSTSFVQEVNEVIGIRNAS